MMKREICILILLIALFIPVQLISQNESIDLEIFQDLQTLDLGALVISGGLENQPRIARLTILPEGIQVKIDLIASWKDNNNNSFQQLFTFRSNPFTSGTYYNDELGSIITGSADWDKDLIKEVASRGKLTGTLLLKVVLYDRNNINLADDEEEFVFFNPAPTITIISPNEGDTYDVGSVIAMWTPVLGASSYKVLANVIPEGSSSPEDALRGANPLIDNRDVGNTTSVDLRSILNREWSGGQRIVLSVSAVISGVGGGEEIPSTPVTFLLNNYGENTTSRIEPELIQLAELLNGQVSQSFIDQIMSGEVSIEEIKDENGNTLSNSDLIRIITFLMGNRDSIISINLLQN